MHEESPDRDAAPVVWLPHADAPRLIGEVPAGLTVLTSADVELAASGAAFVVLPPLPSKEELTTVQSMPGVRVLQLMSSGYDHVLRFCPAGAVLCTARGAHDVAVSEWVLAAILASVRELPRFVRQQDAAAWRQFEVPTLAGQQVLLVGYGSIAAAVEQRLQPFGVGIRRVARRSRTGVHGIAELDSLLGDTDIVVLLLPGGAATEGLFDLRRLDRLKPGALLVNAGRGSVVDTDAMTERVRAGRLRAALDVFDPEPLPATNELWRLHDVLLTPHIASYVESRLAAVYAFIGRQLRSFAAGGQLENVAPDA